MSMMMQEKWKEMMPSIPVEMTVFTPQMREMVMLTRGLVQGLTIPEI